MNVDPKIEDEFLRILRSVRLDNKPQKSRIISFFNSPFFLTFIASLIVGGFTTHIANTHQQRLKANELHRLDIQTKTKVMHDFTEGISRFLRHSLEIKDRQIWLHSRQIATEEQRKALFYPDGRDFYETRDFNEKQVAKFHEMTGSDALCALALANFSESLEIVSDIEALDEGLDLHLRTNDQAIHREYHLRSSNSYQQISRKMGEFIQKLKEEGNP